MSKSNHWWWRHNFLQTCFVTKIFGFGFGWRGHGWGSCQACVKSSRAQELNMWLRKTLYTRNCFRMMAVNHHKKAMYSYLVVLPAWVDFCIVELETEWSFPTSLDVISKWVASTRKNPTSAPTPPSKLPREFQGVPPLWPSNVRAIIRQSMDLSEAFSTPTDTWLTRTSQSRWIYSEPVRAGNSRRFFGGRLRWSFRSNS